MRLMRRMGGKKVGLKVKAGQTVTYRYGGWVDWSEGGGGGVMSESQNEKGRGDPLSVGLRS